MIDMQVKTRHIAKKSITDFQEKLLEWFELNKRDFPWRKEGLSAYEYIIAEVLLQRTKAETVARIYPNFIKEFPNWESINNATLTLIERNLSAIGLQTQRAKRLKSMAETVIQLKGTIPETIEELEKIPFVGQYIANTIVVLIFNKPAPFLDTNMARVLERFFGERKMADIRYDPYLQKLAFNVVNHPMIKEINWAIIDFAGQICLSKKPKCSICKLADKCKFNLNRL